MSAFTLETVQGVSFLTCTPIVSKFPVRLAYSTRTGGVSDGAYTSMNLGFGSGDERARVQTNRTRFAHALGFDTNALVTLRQVHGNRVILVAAEDDPTCVKGAQADALITDRPQVPLAVMTADCFPVLLVSPSVPALGIVHAGRRGTAAHIVEITGKRMCDRFNIEPRTLYAVIGPGIGGCCYEIDAASAEPFNAQYTARDAILRPGRPDHVYLDLQLTNLLQLQAAGIPREQIWTANLCTVCHPEWFFSYRREGARTGRMLNVAVLGHR